MFLRFGSQPDLQLVADPQAPTLETTGARLQHSPRTTDRSTDPMARHPGHPDDP